MTCSHLQIIIILLTVGTLETNKGLYYYKIKRRKVSNSRMCLQINPVFRAFSGSRDNRYVTSGSQRNRKISLPPTSLIAYKLYFIKLFLKIDKFYSKWMGVWVKMILNTSPYRN